MLHIAVEAGSSHNNDLDYIKRLIETCKEHGASSVKFQLFPNTPEFTATGNIPIEMKNFEYAMKVGDENNIPVTASVFSDTDLDYLLTLKPKYIKLAFSQRNQKEWIEKIQCPVVVTATIWDSYEKPVIKLLTAEHGATLYPNPYIMDFSGLFPEYFQGYSDHSIGFENCFNAIQHGAVWIEKHMTLNKEPICPDDKFASKDFRRLLKMRSL